MKIWFVLSFCALLLCCTRSKFNNNFNNKLNTWTTNLCCNSNYQKLEIKNFEIKQSKILNISFCDDSVKPLRLTLLLEKSNKRFDTIFDIEININRLIELDISNPSEFNKGEFNKIKKLNDANYRLGLYGDKFCGEILFKIYKGSLKQKSFMCLKECSS